MDHTINDIGKRTVRKTMTRILPFILILYIIAYLDRVNLGYAALQMNAELALTAEVFGLLSGIFFIGYFFFEVPSNMIMHKVGARMWIARIMISWGIVVILTGVCANDDAIVYCPLFIRCRRSRVFPRYYFIFNVLVQGRERGKATAVLLLALPIGGLIGAPVSTWILDNISWYDMAGWRWMFILEGIPAIILGVVVVFYLTNKPTDAKWLSQEEKDWLEGELSAERLLSSQLNKVSKKDMLKDSKVWKLALALFHWLYGYLRIIILDANHY